MALCGSAFWVRALHRDWRRSSDAFVKLAASGVFGLRQITFWQALGLLALCRILFGGFGLGGGSHRSNSRRMRGRMDERWEQMTPEERGKFRPGLHGRWGRVAPPDSKPSA